MRWGAAGRRAAEAEDEGGKGRRRWCLGTADRCGFYWGGLGVPRESHKRLALPRKGPREYCCKRDADLNQYGVRVCGWPVIPLKVGEPRHPNGPSKLDRSKIGRQRAVRAGRLCQWVLRIGFDPLGSDSGADPRSATWSPGSRHRIASHRAILVTLLNATSIAVHTLPVRPRSALFLGPPQFTPPPLFAASFRDQYRLTSSTSSDKATQAMLPSGVPGYAASPARGRGRGDGAVSAASRDGGARDEQNSWGAQSPHARLNTALVAAGAARAWARRARSSTRSRARRSIVRIAAGGRSCD
ncbi:hypothetical protein DFJ74DRAFT_695703 [Hyaloraphidium curvatum]|nr:hypothetical protein DFJ74DRAFT_695703 [Hyaloraphidium curvatum]